MEREAHLTGGLPAIWMAQGLWEAASRGGLRRVRPAKRLSRLTAVAGRPKPVATASAPEGRGSESLLEPIQAHIRFFARPSTGMVLEAKLGASNARPGPPDVRLGIRHSGPRIRFSGFSARAIVAGGPPTRCCREHEGVDVLVGLVLLEEAIAAAP